MVRAVGGGGESALSGAKVWPWAAAVMVLAAAWLVPLPQAVFSEEQLVVARMPQTRAGVQEARARFYQAQDAYLNYIHTHDMGALLVTLRRTMQDVRAGGQGQQPLDELRTLTAQVLDYTQVLHDYAQAGERYFAALRRYDDDLMAWSRTLGPAIEQLRPYTWPFVEHLKLYPVPTGQKADPPNVSAQQVQAHMAALQEHIEAPQPDVSALSADIDNVWADGRSIEYIESLHDQYYRYLSEYDAKVQEVSVGGQVGVPAGRRALAVVLDLGVGALVLAGLTALFARPQAGRNEAGAHHGGTANP